LNAWKQLNLEQGALTYYLRVSGRDMLEAMIDGENDPQKLADLARRRMKSKKAELDWNSPFKER